MLKHRIQVPPLKLTGQIRNCCIVVLLRDALLKFAHEAQVASAASMQHDCLLELPNFPHGSNLFVPILLQSFHKCENLWRRQAMTWWIFWSTDWMKKLNQEMEVWVLPPPKKKHVNASQSYKLVVCSVHQTVTPMLEVGARCEPWIENLFADEFVANPLPHSTDADTAFELFQHRGGNLRLEAHHCQRLAPSNAESLLDRFVIRPILPDSELSRNNNVMRWPWELMLFHWWATLPDSDSSYDDNNQWQRSSWLLNKLELPLKIAK